MAVIRWVPNILSVARLLLAVAFPLLGAGWRLPAVIAAGVSDGLDGFIARRFDATSAAGGLLDAIGDKLFTCSALVTLAVAGEMQWWHVPMVMARDLAVAGVGVYAAARLDWSKFLEMRPRAAGKLTTLFTFGWLIVVTAGWDVADWPCFILAAGVSLFAAGDYLRLFGVALIADRRAAAGPSDDAASR